jgi:hypothetical protein
MFPAYDPDVGQRHLAAMDPEVYDAASDCTVITYQTFVVRTPHHTILVDTCTGEDKGYPAPMDFPKQPWLGLAIPALRICRETTESAPNAPHGSSSWPSLSRPYSSSLPAQREDVDGRPSPTMTI